MLRDRSLHVECPNGTANYTNSKASINLIHKYHLGWDTIALNGIHIFTFFFYVSIFSNTFSIFYSKNIHVNNRKTTHLFHHPYNKGNWLGTLPLTFQTFRGKISSVNFAILWIMIDISIYPDFDFCLKLHNAAVDEVLFYISQIPIILVKTTWANRAQRSF